MLAVAIGVYRTQHVLFINLRLELLNKFQGDDAAARSNRQGLEAFRVCHWRTLREESATSQSGNHESYRRSLSLGLVLRYFKDVYIHIDRHALGWNLAHGCLLENAYLSVSIEISGETTADVVIRLSNVTNVAL